MSEEHKLRKGKSTRNNKIQKNKSRFPNKKKIERDQISKKQDYKIYYPKF